MIRKTYALTVIYLVVCLYGCGDLNQPTATVPSSTNLPEATSIISPTLAATPTLHRPEATSTVTATEKTVLPTETPLASATATLTLTPAPTPTPTEEPGIFETVYVFPHKEFPYPFSQYMKDPVVINSEEFWMLTDQVYYFKDGTVQAQVPISDLTGNCITFEITQDNTILLFDTDDWPRRTAKIRLFEIDLAGTVLVEHRLPNAILVDAKGDYIEGGLTDLWWRNDGVLVLGGDEGFYQILNARGSLSVKRLQGYGMDAYVYRPIKTLGSRLDPATIMVNGLTIPITTTLDKIGISKGYSLGGFIGSKPNGDFFLQIREIINNNVRQITLRHYSVLGDLITQITLLEDQNLYPWDYPLSVLGRDGNIYVFFRDRGDDESRLVRVRIE